MAFKIRCVCYTGTIIYCITEIIAKCVWTCAAVSKHINLHETTPIKFKNKINFKTKIKQH